MKEDNFITQRAFCDVLAVECAQGRPPKTDEDHKAHSIESTPHSTSTASPPPHSCSACNILKFMYCKSSRATKKALADHWLERVYEF
ncbi:hypothetical protein L1987_53113 [Smallanthus sonchifolius]|uniref:Uncharacterized protein n=1 Tax=Smallanthus sonchifolius TaxID=185202 RepID=A0ACB9EVL6_9ASTR|nr:hypothetical protein L1987_53113 [Smallanthus sonchifolius]